MFNLHNGGILFIICFTTTMNNGFPNLHKYIQLTITHNISTYNIYIVSNSYHERTKSNKKCKRKPESSLNHLLESERQAFQMPSQQQFFPRQIHGHSHYFFPHHFLDLCIYLAVDQHREFCSIHKHTDQAPCFSILQPTNNQQKGMSKIIILYP